MFSAIIYIVDSLNKLNITRNKLVLNSIYLLVGIIKNVEEVVNIGDTLIKNVWLTSTKKLR